MTFYKILGLILIVQIIISIIVKIVHSMHIRNFLKKSKDPSDAINLAYVAQCKREMNETLLVLIQAVVAIEVSIVLLYNGYKLFSYVLEVLHIV